MFNDQFTNFMTIISSHEPVKLAPTYHCLYPDDDGGTYVLVRNDFLDILKWKKATKGFTMGFNYIINFVTGTQSEFALIILRKIFKRPEQDCELEGMRKFSCMPSC